MPFSAEAMPPSPALPFIADDMNRVGSLASPELVAATILPFGGGGGSKYKVSDHVIKMEGDARYDGDYKIRTGMEDNYYKVELKMAYDVTMKYTSWSGKEKKDVTETYTWKKGETKTLSSSAGPKNSQNLQQASPTGRRDSRMASEPTGYKGIPLSEIPDYRSSNESQRRVKAKGIEQPAGIIFLPGPLPFLPPIPIFTPFTQGS